MGRDELSRIGSADEAQTPPASVPPPLPGSGPSHRLVHRRLAQQEALAQFGRKALRATALEPLLAEAAALLHREFPALVSGTLTLLLDRDEDEVAFAEAVADMVDAAGDALRAVDECRHAALHDPLTALANRSLILDHLQVALSRAERRSALAAVIFVDLDAFKHINDTLGHVAGDELLVRVAERLRPAVRPADTLGRWGGDEFLVVCEDLATASDASAIAGRVAAAFEAPFDVGDVEIHVAASIGVAVSGGADQPAAVIAAADAAMYEAKREHPARLRSGHEPAPVLVGAGLAKHERLTLRLLEVLSTLEIDEEPQASSE